LSSMAGGADFGTGRRRGATQSPTIHHLPHRGGAALSRSTRSARASAMGAGGRTMLSIVLSTLLSIAGRSYLSRLQENKDKEPPSGPWRTLGGFAMVVRMVVRGGGRSRLAGRVVDDGGRARASLAHRPDQPSVTPKCGPIWRARSKRGIRRHNLARGAEVAEGAVWAHTSVGAGVLWDIGALTEHVANVVHTGRVERTAPPPT
jgi:hypothetical protein